MIRRASVLGILLISAASCSLRGAAGACDDPARTVAVLRRLARLDWRTLGHSEVRKEWPRVLAPETVWEGGERTGEKAVNLHSVRSEIEGECACCDTLVFGGRKRGEHLQVVIVFHTAGTREAAVATAREFVAATRPAGITTEGDDDGWGADATKGIERKFRWFDKGARRGTRVDAEIESASFGWRVYLYFAQDYLD